MSLGNVVNTSLYEDIKGILNSPGRPDYIRAKATIHTEKEDFSPMKVLLFENYRDYYRETGEVFFITVLMSFGDYVWRVLPFRNHLELTFHKEIFQSNGKDQKDKPNTDKRFKAVLDTSKNPYISGDTISNMTPEDLNKVPPLEITFELVDRREELLRLIPMEGTFRNTTIEELLRGYFSSQANRFKVDGKPILQALEIDKPDNKGDRPTLMLKSGMLLRDLPGYLQEKSKGVYTSGIGSFFQDYQNKPTWFVYPLYRTSRFSEDRPKLVIYAAPQDRFPEVEKSYRVEGKTVYIVVNAEKKEVDNANNIEMNNGVGFRLPDQEAFLTKPVAISETGFRAVRNNLNHEVAIKARKDGVNYARVTSSETNPFMEYSRILSQEFSVINMSWQASNPDLLIPGMPCKFVSMHRGKYVERLGTLVKANTILKMEGKIGPEASYFSVSSLMVLLEPYSDTPDNRKDNSVSEVR